jgi:hypothetical protein
MKEKQEKLRQSLIVIILACYLAPVMLLTLLTAGSMDVNARWLLFSSGLLLAICATIILALALIKWEGMFLQSPQEASFAVSEKSFPVPPAPKPDLSYEAVNEFQQKEDALQQEIHEIKQKWFAKKQAYDELKKQMEKVRSENETLLRHSQEQLKKKDRLLAEYAQTVNDLRSTMENKQEQIEKLQDSINDLSYDLDTLLKLSDFESVEEAQQEDVPKVQENAGTRKIPPKPVDSLNAAYQLKKCIDIAQKFTSSQFTTASRFRDVSIDNIALDQRRLFDSFRSETSCLVIMYSLKEGTMLFANDMTKTYLGLEPEKFVHDYLSHIVQGADEWRKALASLAHQSEAQLHLVMRAQSGEDVLLECRLGVVPTGVFKNHAVGILYEI